MNKYFDYILEHGDVSQMAIVSRMFSEDMTIDVKEKMVERFLEICPDKETLKNSTPSRLGMKPEEYIRMNLYGENYKPKGKKQKDGKIKYDEKDNKYFKSDDEIWWDEWTQKMRNGEIRTSAYKKGYRSPACLGRK